MQIKRKKWLRGVRIVGHNRVLGYIILFLIACLVVTVVAIKVIGNGNSNKINNTLSECSLDSDCVRASCCHASSCVPVVNAPNCKGLYCTMECINGTLDCGQGSCGCVEGKCNMVINNKNSLRA